MCIKVLSSNNIFCGVIMDQVNELSLRSSEAHMWSGRGRLVVAIFDARGFMEGLRIRVKIPLIWPRQ